ncbi:MAG: diadenylate cyclase CdaA [Thermostichales cyanobacterium SZTDM-1c_bins_54]
MTGLGKWLQALTPTQWLDGLMVVTLVVLTLRLTRHTRARSLIWGTLVLLALYFLTSPLPVLHLVLDKLLTAAAVVLGFVFQPELRRGLEFLGFWLGGDRDPSHVSGQQPDWLEQVVEAVKELSQNRTGALIVIEHERPIDPKIFTEPGVPLDAQVSQELLCTIFQPNTPLHDGAVVIRDQVVKAAGVLLPMSERSHSRQLGTRHRAALGLTEQANCLCVVVSEETGSISLAEAGRIERPLSSSKLREMLRTRLQPVAPPSVRWKSPLSVAYLLPFFKGKGSKA